MLAFTAELANISMHLVCSAISLILFLPTTTVNPKGKTNLLTNEVQNIINLTRFIGGCVSFFTIIMSKDAHADQGLGGGAKVKTWDDTKANQ